MDAAKKNVFQILRIPSGLRTLTHIESLLNLTKDVQFFQRISSEQGSTDIHRECCKVMNLEEYSEGDIIFNFGDKGEKFYIILSGSVAVKTPVKKKVMVNKDAATKIERILESDESESSESEVSEEKEAKRREGHVVINVYDVMNSLNPVAYLSEQEQNSKQAILSTEEKNLLVAFKGKVRKEQQVLMNFIKRSERDIVEIELDDFIEIGVLSSGSSFGELALISERPRSATIQVRERSAFLVLYKSDFTKILGGIAEKRLNVIIKFMQQLIYFKSWSRVSLVRLAYFLQIKRFKRGQYIYHEGNIIDGIYFIKEGEVTITKKRPVKVSEFPPIFASSPLEFTSRFIKKKQNQMVEVKVIIKGIHESIGGADVFEERPNREFSCVCSSSFCDVYFMSKECFLTRVPNLDAIKEILKAEQGRLLERFKEMCEVGEEIDNPKSIRSTTPNSTYFKTEISEIKAIERSSSKCLQALSPGRRSIPIIRKNIAGGVFHKLTVQEVYEAVNGRSPLVRKYANRINVENSLVMVSNKFSKISRKNTLKSLHK